MGFAESDRIQSTSHAVTTAALRDLEQNSIGQHREGALVEPRSPASGLRILILTPDPNQHGGVVHYLQLLKQRLDPTVNATFFVMGKRMGERGVMRTALRLAYDELRFFWVMATRRYDVVHFNPTLDPASTLREAGFLLVLKLLQFHRTVIFFRGWDVAFERRIAAHPLYRRLFLWLFGSAAQILVLSSAFARSLRKLGCPCPVAVVTTTFDGQSLRQALQESTAQDKRSTVLYLSRFVREKGVYELLDAFARLHTQYPNVRLVMAGDGPEREGMKQAAHRLGIEDKVEFPGYLRGLDKARAFVHARVFVLATSFKEGMPNALLEAMAAGNVVVTTRVAAIPEVVDDPDNGVLLDAVDADGIAAALARILSDDAYAGAVRTRNMEKAWGRYEASIVARQIEEIYADAAGRTASQ